MTRVGKELHLESELTLGSVLNAFHFFDQAKKSSGDALGLGWRLVPPTEKSILKLARESKITAESMVAMAAMLAVFDEDDRPALVNVHQPEILRFLSIKDATPQPRWVKLSNDQFALLFDKIETREVKGLPGVVDGMVRVILDSAGEFYQPLKKLRSFFKRLLLEALLNVNQHSREDGMPSFAWVAIVCTRKEGLRRIHGREPVSDLRAANMSFMNSMECEWGIELSVSDNGVGIPFSLAPTAREILPDLVKKVSKISAGRREFRDKRRAIHAGLCYYSFDHCSTSKGRDGKVFTPPAQEMNWRGLYRCYRQVVDLGGMIAVVSGRGMGGYLSERNRKKPLCCSLPTESDYPGTLLSVKIPLEPKPRSWGEGETRTKKRDIKFASDPLCWETLSSNHTSITWGKGSYVAVTLPFLRLVDDNEQATEGSVQISKLRSLIPRIPLERIPVFCFGELAEGCKEYFRSFVADESWESEYDGPPRLIGFLSGNSEVNWCFAGAIHQDLEDWIKRLEEFGEVNISDSPAAKIVESLAEINSHHAGVMRYFNERKEFRLLCHNSVMSDRDCEKLVAHGFQQFWKREDVQREIVTDEDGKAVVLPTGVCVQRHVSVFLMLNFSPLLCRTIGSVLLRMLRRYGGPQNPVVVLAHPSCRFNTVALLGDSIEQFRIVSVREACEMEHSSENAIVFTDCMFQGATVETVIQELRKAHFNVVKAITVVDLRRPSAGQGILGIDVESLVDLTGFDPEPITGEGGEQIQCDAITNVPIRESSSEFIHLGAITQGAGPGFTGKELFCVGYHTRGGRIHTYALPIGNLISTGRSILITQLTSQIVEHVKHQNSRDQNVDLVFYYWISSKIGSLVRSVAEKVSREASAVGDTYAVAMPVVHRGSDMVFPQASSNLLVSCTEIETGQFEFSSRRTPRDGYVAIYLGDSAVTGNSLRDLLYRLSRAESPSASSVLSLVGVNRLSPAEVRFFGLCRTLQWGKKRLGFAYSYLYNLQIRSRPGGAPAWNSLFDSIISDPVLRVAELGEFVDKIRLKAARKQKTEPLLHLFCPGNERCEVSVEAIRLRHLISLMQQNEPVAIEFMTLLKRLTDDDTLDPSLLTVIALEPNLVIELPIMQFGRDSILKLAESTLCNPNQPVEIKADALTVIASFPGALQKCSKDIALPIFKDEALRNIFVVFLLIQQERASFSADAVVTACLKHLSDEEAYHSAEHLLNIIAVCTQNQKLESSNQPVVVAKELIENLGSHFLHHAEAFTNWDRVVFALYNLAENHPDDVSTEDKASVHQLVNKTLGIAKGIVIPAFTGFAVFARKQLKSDLAEKLLAEQVEALDVLARIVKEQPASSAGYSQTIGKRLRTLFDTLRQITWYTPSSDRLPLKDFREQSIGSLPLALYDMFSTPSASLQSVAKEILRDSKPFGSFRELTSSESDNYLTVCPIPSQALIYVFELLLQNIEKHGTSDGLEVNVPKGFPECADNGTHTWAVEIVNAIGIPGQSSGNGLQAAKEKGAEYGMEIISKELEQGSSWFLSIKIPNCFYFHRRVKELPR